jgi:hypothetical protein
MARRGQNMLWYRDIITSIKKLSIPIAGICMKDSYVYIMQQDAPRKDKKSKIVVFSGRK